MGSARLFRGTFLPKQLRIVEASGEAPPGTVKPVGGTYRLDVCAGPLREYGRTILEIDPDGDENFVRKGHS